MPELSPELLKFPTVGTRIRGKYVLEDLLGRGGMGAVYAARHLVLGHRVAIKIMLAEAANHEAASRFINEGRAAANIQSDHVVRVFDVDEEDGFAYMVLELLEGEDLGQLLARGRLSPMLAASYVMQALEGVRYAHAQGIVHRDLKPSNLFLAKRQDGTEIIKVLDFGISKARANDHPLHGPNVALTSTKAMLGSPLYMSPEQLRSSKSVDARADIWAFGVILFELVTGQLPFIGENLGELFAQILETDAPPLRARAPDAPTLLEAIVARCLRRRAEERYQTVAELERDLAAVATPSTSAPALVASIPALPHVGATVRLDSATPQPSSRSMNAARVSDDVRPAHRMGLFVGVALLGVSVVGALVYVSQRVARVPPVGVAVSSPVVADIPRANPFPNATPSASAPSASIASASALADAAAPAPRVPVVHRAAPLQAVTKARPAVDAPAPVPPLRAPAPSEHTVQQNER